MLNSFIYISQMVLYRSLTDKESNQVFFHTINSVLTIDVCTMGILHTVKTVSVTLFFKYLCYHILSWKKPWKLKACNKKLYILRSWPPRYYLILCPIIITGSRKSIFFFLDQIMGKLTLTWQKVWVFLVTFFWRVA